MAAKGVILKTGLGLVLFFITGFSLLAGNETIFPSALVVFILYLQAARPKRTAASRESGDGRAARYAVVTFAFFLQSSVC